MSDRDVNIGKERLGSGLHKKVGFKTYLLFHTLGQSEEKNPIEFDRVMLEPIFFSFDQAYDSCSDNHDSQIIETTHNPIVNRFKESVGKSYRSLLWCTEQS